MDEIQTMISGAQALFALVVTLAITVTGFFLGRKWIKRV